MIVLLESKASGNNAYQCQEQEVTFCLGASSHAMMHLEFASKRALQELLVGNHRAK